MDDRQPKNEGFFEEEDAQSEWAQMTEKGSVKDNPYNTRRNHLLTLLWACLLAAALIGMDYINRTVLTEPLDGYMDVAVHRLKNGPEYSKEYEYYTIAENGEYERTDPFQADETEFLVTDYYEHELERTNYLAEYRLFPDEDRDDFPDGEEVELTPVLKRILELVEEEEADHWIFKARILRTEDHYFVCVDRNVNWWTPYMLFYYSEEQDRLRHIATFDDRSVTDIRLSEEFEQRVG